MIELLLAALIARDMPSAELVWREPVARTYVLPTRLAPLPLVGSAFDQAAPSLFDCRSLSPICCSLAIRFSNTDSLSEPASESHLIEVARSAIAAAVTGKASAVKFEQEPSKAVFVTIEIDGVVRGCRGDLQARTRSLDDEVALAAGDAATKDPRYRPLTAKELEHFLVTVTLVDRTEPISSVDDLKPDDGLVLTSGSHTGIVLPWEGKDPHTRLEWAYKKAKVSRNVAVSLSRLIARRFRG